MPLREAWDVTKAALKYACTWGVLLGFIWAAQYFSPSLSVGEAWPQIAPWLKWGFYALVVIVVTWALADILSGVGIQLITFSDQWTRATWRKRIGALVVLTTVCLGLAFAPTTTFVVGLPVVSILTAIENWKFGKRQEWFDQREAEQDAAKWADAEEGGEAS